MLRHVPIDHAIQFETLYQATRFVIQGPRIYHYVIFDLSQQLVLKSSDIHHAQKVAADHSIFRLRFHVFIRFERVKLEAALHSYILMRKDQILLTLRPPDSNSPLAASPPALLYCFSQPSPVLPGSYLYLPRSL